jgi:hypothetical protein
MVLLRLSVNKFIIIIIIIIIITIIIITVTITVFTRRIITTFNNQGLSSIGLFQL